MVEVINERPVAMIEAMVRNTMPATPGDADDEENESRDDGYT
jgi:hypothetical protein